MSEAKHTPGPWAVERRFSNECEIVPRITCQRDEDRGCGWIADAIGAPYLGHQSTLPNAYLIAASPDLLASCEAAHELIERVGDRRKDKHVLDLLKAALAKAKGESA